MTHPHVKESLYEHLRGQVKTLDDAHDYFKKWHEQMDQEIPGYGVYGWRSMAAMLSLVLEGADWDKTGEIPYYIHTKYGVEIYNGIRD